MNELVDTTDTDLDSLSTLVIEKPAASSIITTQTRVNSELLAKLHTGTSNPQAVQKYEAEMMEVANRVVKGDLSDMEAILSSQIINLNNLFTRFANSADLHSCEGHIEESEKYAKMALACADKAMKAIAQLTKMKAPKKGSVYIRTLNNQNNH